MIQFDLSDSVSIRFFLKFPESLEINGSVFEIIAFFYFLFIIKLITGGLLF